MKQVLGWYWPDHEEHLIQWMKEQKPPVINGRAAYQGLKQLAVRKHCKQFRTAIDVGAHCGLWSFNLAHWFDHVVAFEPVAAHRECFAANVKSAKVDLIPCALGAVEGYVSIETTEGSSGDSRVSGDGEIPLHRLDRFDILNVDLIKIDCEGFEENVLRGAEETIKRWRPTIIVEQKRDMATNFGLEPEGALLWLRHMSYKSVANLGGDHIMVPQ